MFPLILSFFLVTPLFSAPHDLNQRIKDAALRSSLDPSLIKAIVQVESNFESRATSLKGAMGLMQVMPKTAEAQGIRQPYHATENLMGACDYLRTLINRYRGNIKWALAAYNAGPGNVDRYGGIPPFKETQLYVKKVLGIYQRLKKESPESVKDSR
ncbi:MAG: lytic transglycosylase domain-containing protein [Proteobacteria bacterium]|nr:lytic transglycosylase domain-containing protein [Pseudomonadota bacterium]